jgi:RNA polymerase sigma-70 factor, ECF subfamily
VPPSGGGVNDPAALAARIHEGDRDAMETLYRDIRKTFWYRLCSGGAQDAEDRLHDCFITVVEGIRDGKWRDPGSLPGYVRSVILFQWIVHCRSAARTDAIEDVNELGAKDPEESCSTHELASVAARVLSASPARHRELLSRLYLDDQTPAQICAAMGLSDPQFRVLKCRAKARFGAKARRQLGRAA